VTKKIVRLKLTDFINSEVEDTVMSFLQMIEKETPTFKILFWYDKNGISGDALLKFRKKYKDEIGTLELDIVQLCAFNSSVWYDIIKVEDSEKIDNFKFRSTYSNINNIVECIMEFNSMIKFDSQKNNGYRNAKDRNYRFKTVGKQVKD